MGKGKWRQREREREGCRRPYNPGETNSCHGEAPRFMCDMLYSQAIVQGLLGHRGSGFTCTTGINLFSSFLEVYKNILLLTANAEKMSNHIILSTFN